MRARLAALCAFMLRLCSCTKLIITISLASEPCMQHQAFRLYTSLIAIC